MYQICEQDLVPDYRGVLYLFCALKDKNQIVGIQGLTTLFSALGPKTIEILTSLQFACMTSRKKMYVICAEAQIDQCLIIAN